MTSIKLIRELIRQIADDIGEAVEAHLIRMGVDPKVADAIGELLELVLTAWATNDRSLETAKRIVDLSRTI